MDTEKRVREGKKTGWITEQIFQTAVYSEGPS
jgi:hypothetical protein